MHLLVFCIGTLALTSCQSGSSTTNSGSNSSPTLTAVAVTPAAPSVGIGATQQFKATASYSDGSSKDVTTSAAWSSANSSIASIQSTGQASPGMATGLAAGAVNITATFSGVSGVTSLTVTSTISPVVTAISVGPAGATVSVGSSAQFIAMATYSDGSVKAVTASASWSSSNPAIASIQSTGQASPGLATGVAVGMATIMATFSGISGSTTLTVATGPVVTSISLSPTAVTISVGGTQQFTATAGYSDGSSKTITSLATWTSTDPTIASIQSTGQTSPGLATGVAPGNVNITASYGGVNAVTTLNVIGNTGTLTNIYIIQLNASIAPAATLQLFCYAVYSDGSSQWVTSTTTWTSSNPTVASIENQGQAAPGLVTAGSTPGVTTITANFTGLQTTTTLTVAANAVPIDLMDMTSSNNYLNFQGGLYENSSDTVPTDHDAAGKAAAAAIQPLDQTGKPSSAGAVVFLGIGMSNATEEFSDFINTAAVTAGVNHTTLAMEDGASGAETACYWTVAQGQTGTACPQARGSLLDNQYDRVRDSVLATATTAPSAPAGCGGPPNPVPCLTEAQVQVLWIKNANPRPGASNERALCDATVTGCVNDLGTEAVNYESQLGQTIRAAKSRYPNLQQVFLSTRIYAGYATDGLNPETYAYEYGYSAKWLIEAQVLQMRNQTVDPIAGDMSYTDGSAAWTAWGTYLWADGDIPRSDGLVWLPTDFQADGTHPDPQGAAKVVNLLMTFYLGSPYSPWFRP
jgi:uncharacterized protein YjdB